MSPPAESHGSRRRRQRLTERWIEAGIHLFGISAIGIVAAIFVFILREAWPFLVGHFDPVEFFTSPEWVPVSATRNRYGALALFLGTFAVAAGSMILSLPVGLLGALYLSELAPPKVREVAKIGIETLAAIPSVVFGFVAIAVVNPLIIRIFDVPIGLNVLNASIVLALMSLPVIVSLGEDALRAVPDSYREAAEALGATRLETAVKVVVPAARNGLLASALLGTGRAIGETMAVLMATGHSVRIPTSVFDPVRTLTATIAAELGESPKGGEHYQSLFVLGLCLFVLTGLVNGIADLAIRRRGRH